MLALAVGGGCHRSSSNVDEDLARSQAARALRYYPKSGRVIWHYLVTGDIAKSLLFYQGVMGWQAEWTSPEYVLLSGSTGRVGAMMKLADDLRAKGVPPYWTCSLETPDVDAAVRLVREEGGTVLVPAKDVPDSRFAVVLDPHGVPFTVSHPKQPTGVPDDTRPTEFWRTDLWTADGAGALRFYEHVFGWKVLQDRPLGDGSDYYVLGRDGVTLNVGVFASTRVGKEQWMTFLQVADLEAAIRRATHDGASVTQAPQANTEGRFAELVDPQGAPFGLFERGKI